MKRFLLGGLGLVIAVACFGQSVAAEDEFSVESVLGDGKNGRVFNKWTQHVPDRPITEVHVEVEKRRGGKDTFVNLRFGNDSAFEAGRRVYLTDGQSTTVPFLVNGQMPKGRPLVLNAYNGEVYVHSVRVIYGGRPADVVLEDHRPPPRVRKPLRARDYERSAGSEVSRDREIEESCRNTRVRRPRIELAPVRTSGGLFSGKYRISGSLYGACIKEAGYFEDGRLMRTIDIPFSKHYERVEFSFQVKPGRDGEIRAYTSDGMEELVDVDEEIKRTQ